MRDEDLPALHAVLRRMEPDAQVKIGHYRCTASELLWVVEEALSHRAVAKAAGTFQPYKSPLVT